MNPSEKYDIADFQKNIDNALNNKIDIFDIPKELFYPAIKPYSFKIYCYLLACAERGEWPTVTKIYVNCIGGGLLPNERFRSFNSGKLTIEAAFRELKGAGLAWWEIENIEEL